MTASERPKSKVVQGKRSGSLIKYAIFVIVSAFVLDALIKNREILKALWTSSGEYAQSQWEKIYDYYGGTATVGMGVFWIVNSIFLIMDYTNKPQFILKYKVHEDENVPLDRKRLAKAFAVVLFNQFVISSGMLVVFHYMIQTRGCNFDRQLPTLTRIFWDLVVTLLIEEFVAYYIHRVLHHPRFYKHMHKIHHEWTAPIGFVCIYAHPLEHALANLFPLMLGPLICRSHIFTIWVWLALSITATTLAHCGYHFPLFPSPEYHDFHHVNFNQNYGVCGLLDRLHGTDSGFRKSKAYERHFMAFTLVPVKQLIPDDQKEELAQ